MKETLKALRNFWERENTREFMRCAYMHRKELEEIDERYIDALELVVGIDDRSKKHKWIEHLLDMTGQYIDDQISKCVIASTIDFSIWAIREFS